MAVCGESLICRLCFGSLISTEGSAFTSIRKYSNFLSHFAGFEVSWSFPEVDPLVNNPISSPFQILETDGFSENVCLPCQAQIESAELLRQQVIFTQGVWTRFHSPETEALEDERPTVQPSGFLLICHVCGFKSQYEELQSHIASDHGADHVSDCNLCRSLISRNTVENMRYVTIIYIVNIPQHFLISFFIPAYLSKQILTTRR